MPSLVALALAIGFGAILAGSAIGDALERRERVAAEWATPALVQAVEAAVAASGACCAVAAGACPAGASPWPASGEYRIDWTAISAHLTDDGMRDLLAGVAPEALINPDTGMVRLTLTAGDAAGQILVARMASSGGWEATKDLAGGTLRINLPPLGDDGPLPASWRMDAPEPLPRARCARPPSGPADLSHLQPETQTNTNGWTHPWQ